MVVFGDIIGASCLAQILCDVLFPTLMPQYAIPRLGLAEVTC